MEAFCQKRSINMQKIPPLHPLSNLVETFIKPLGKTMKIAHKYISPEKEALEQLLQSYHGTPHPATNVTPVAMLFCDRKRFLFPRQTITDKQVAKARETGYSEKENRQQELSTAKYAKKDNFLKLGIQYSQEILTKGKKLTLCFYLNHM